MGIRINHFILICGNSPSENVISAVAVANKLIMHIVAIVLAILTRNVRERLYAMVSLGACVYVCSAC